ncbi:AbrB family transcriptional regulator [Cucumibacter marinus]|uniref:AbrB family transcriptional regulator n=1 Tax=Cucumibacter marinus TaxID=1121252 RepID=UPI0004054141|nr:AbrB family transcriptional regulator [Cucumibacter marinus]
MRPLARFGTNPLAGAAIALALSALGGTLALLAGLPAPFLVGGVFFVTVAALAGLPIDVPGPLRNYAFVVIGMSMGSSVARDTLNLIAQWPVTIAALVVSLIVMIYVTTQVLYRWFGFDASTAVLAATPGHASFIQGLAMSGLGDPAQIAVAQSIRVLFLTMVVPLVIQVAAPEAIHAIEGQVQMDWITVGWLAGFCALVGWVMLRLKVPAGFIIGAMAAATVMRLMGYTEGSVPTVLVIPSFIIMGTLIGSRFSGIRAETLRRSALGGVALTAIAIGVSALAALIASWFLGFPYGQIWIALAPGGLEAMAVMGLALGYDPAFFMAHHATRLFLLGVTVPLLVAMVRRRIGRAASPETD